MTFSFLKTVILATIAGSASCNAAALNKDKQDPAFGGSDWHKYVRSPKTSIVTPKTILSANTTGDVRETFSHHRE